MSPFWDDTLTQYRDLIIGRWIGFTLKIKVLQVLVTSILVTDLYSSWNNIGFSVRMANIPKPDYWIRKMLTHKIMSYSIVYWWSSWSILFIWYIKYFISIIYGFTSHLQLIITFLIIGNDLMFTHRFLLKERYIYLFFSLYHTLIRERLINQIHFWFLITTQRSRDVFTIVCNMNT